MKKITAICLAVVTIGAWTAVASNNLTHISWNINRASFSSADFASESVIERLLRAAGHQWLQTAGSRSVPELTGTSTKDSCPTLPGQAEYFIVGNNDCQDPPACQIEGTETTCALGGHEIVMNQLAKGFWTATPPTQSNDKVYFFTVAMHEFGHSLGLSDINSFTDPDLCTMDDSTGTVDSNLKDYACVSDSQDIKSNNSNNFSGSPTFMLASSSGGYPLVLSSSFTVTSNSPGWGFGFADFTAPASLNGSTFFGETYNTGSANWPSWNPGPIGQISSFTTDTIIARPSVVNANGTLWAFWVAQVSGGHDYRIKFATSTDNSNWTQRGFVTGAGGVFAKAHAQPAVSYDATTNKIIIAWTAWDFTAMVTGGTCPSTGCTREITMMTISASTPGGTWSAPMRINQTSVSPPAMFCNTSTAESSFIQCQLVWSATDSGRSLIQSYVKIFSGSIFSSGASFMGGFTDYPPSVDGDIRRSGGYGIVAAHTGDNGALNFAVKSCAPDCGSFGSWFSAIGFSGPGQLGPVVKVDTANQFYRIYLPN